MVVVFQPCFGQESSLARIRWRAFNEVSNVLVSTCHITKRGVFSALQQFWTQSVHCQANRTILVTSISRGTDWVPRLMQSGCFAYIWQRTQQKRLKNITKQSQALDTSFKLVYRCYLTEHQGRGWDYRPSQNLGIAKIGLTPKCVNSTCDNWRQSASIYIICDWWGCIKKTSSQASKLC